MIDYIKAELLNNSPVLENEYFLERVREVNTTTGEVVGNKSTTEFMGFKFSFYDPVGLAIHPRIIIRGSLHKYKNDGRGNYDDFTLAHLKTVVNELSSYFNFDWGKLKLLNLEYGVNINPSVPSKQIIDGVMFYKSTEFKNITQFSSGRFKKAEFQRFSIKCYDKKIQYRNAIMPETLRFEIHIRKMEYLQKFGISTIDDLMCQNKLKSLGNDLVEKWQNILFFDFSITPSANEFLYYQWSNPNFWKKLRAEYGRTNRKKISTELLKMYSFFGQSNSKMKEEIRSLIEAKWLKLLDKDDRLSIQSSSPSLETKDYSNYLVNTFPKDTGTPKDGNNS